MSPPQTPKKRIQYSIKGNETGRTFDTKDRQ